MKRPFLICLLLAFATLLEAQSPLQAPQSPLPSLSNGYPEASRSSGTQGWLYSRSRTYNWDIATVSWDSAVQYFYSYDIQERPMEIIAQSWDVSTSFTNATRQTYTYTASGLPLVNSSDRWDNGQWVLNSQLQWYYDSLENVVAFIFLDGTSSPTIDTLAYLKVYITYDSMGRILRSEQEERAYMSGQWDFTIAYDYDYGTGTGWESRTYSNWFNGSWVPNTRTRDVQWFDFSKLQPQSYFEDSYNAMQQIWVPATENLFSYGANGGRDEMVKTYDSNSAQYLFTNRYESIYNTYGDVLETWNYIYDDSAMAWNAIGGQNYIHTYNTDDNLVETILQYYDPVSTSHENNLKYEYFDYALAAPEPAALADFTQWAPHPAGQEGILKVDAESPGRLFVEVLDAQGKLVRSYSLSQNSGTQFHRLDLNLPAGMYLYRAQMNGQVDSGNLLVR